jgi:hypothetical protein
MKANCPMSGMQRIGGGTQLLGKGGTVRIGQPVKKVGSEAC